MLNPIRVSLLGKPTFIIELVDLPAGSLARVVGAALSDGERSYELNHAVRKGGALLISQIPFRTLAEWESDTTRYIPHRQLNLLLDLTAQHGIVSLGKEMYGCRAVRPGSVPTSRFLSAVEEILG